MWLLEEVVVGLEGEEGTGPLEGDVTLLEQAATGAATGLPPGADALACVAYRATQKRIARHWLGRARRLLDAEMDALRELQGSEGG